MTEMNVATNGASKKIVMQDIKDSTQIGLIAVYLVQKLGKPTLKEIQDAAKNKLGANIHGASLRRALEGAARVSKGTVAILQHRDPDTGVVQDCYALKDPQRWRSAPEMAHINDLLPRILQDPEAVAIKAWFDKDEVTKGPNEKKARGNDVDDYHNYAVLIYVTDTLLGSQIHCPYMDSARAKMGIKKPANGEKPEMEAIFSVDATTGNRILASDALNGWFMTNAIRYSGAPEARGLYVAFRPVQIPSSVPIEQYVLPVFNTKQGPSAPKSYEATPPGMFLVLEFTAPAKGLLNSDQLEKLFHIIGNRPRRGLSPARGKRFGHFITCGFRNYGAMKTTGIDYVLDALPESARKKLKKPPVSEFTTGMGELGAHHLAYIEDAVNRLRNVALQAGSKDSSTDESPFPNVGSAEEEVD